MLPNAWDVASARAVVDAGFPVVATTSGGVAASLGYEDHEGAPGDEMLQAAGRIARAVDVPVTVDAEAGYGMAPVELVRALAEAGAAGCNLEDTDHASRSLRDVGGQAEWLAAVRQAAADVGYDLVINARIDVFLAGAGAEPAAGLLDEAMRRARAYLASGADCVYPILLREPGAIGRFVESSGGWVNILAPPDAPSLAQLAGLGVARVSYGSSLHTRVVAHLRDLLSGLDR